MAQLEKTAKDTWHQLDYITEETNILGNKDGKKEGGRYLITSKEAGDSVKYSPIKGNSEGDNGRSKAPDLMDNMHLEAGQGQVWEERHKRVLG